MRSCILLIIIVLGRFNAWSADTLQVTLNTSVFKKGDTIEFKCTIPNYAALKLNSATLNVWIEDVGKNKRWKFRYPMINGEVSGSLAVGYKIPEGKYAINFLVQRGFFKLMGEILNFDKRDSLINYMMIPRNKRGSYFDNTHVAADGSFRLKSTLFQDSAYFIFTPVKKVKNNELLIRIEAPLDSFFVPAASSTRFITVGNMATVDPATPSTRERDTNSYVFNSEEPVDKTLLPGVTVTGIIKKKIDQFNEENSRGLFQRDDAIIFDGIDSEEISRSFSILQFLQGKVAGLSVVKDDTTGYDIAKWRNETVEIYLDEFRMEPGDNLFIIPADVAMIKVYRPPAQISAFSGGAGAIAIYTKKGKYAANRARHNFIVKGYTAMDSIWE